MSVFVTLVLGIGILIYYFLTWSFDYWKKKNVPGPTPKPLFGTIPSVILSHQNATYDYDNHYKKYKDQYKYIGLFLIKKPQLFVLDPELVKTVLIKNFKNFHDNEFADNINTESDPLLSRNPFFLQGEEWKEKRAISVPAFSNARIKAMYPIIEDVCDIMVKYLKKESDKRLIKGTDAIDLAEKFTTDVVSNCIFGLDAGSFGKEKPEIREMGRKILEPTYKFILYFFATSTFPWIRKIYSFSIMNKDVEIFFTKLMRDAIEHREKNKIDRADFLNYLLQLRERKGMPEIEMAAHTMTFFLDGFVTSSILLSYCMYCLGGNKAAQTKLRNEIRNAMGSDKKIDYDVLTELPYLNQVIYETLRLYPPATVINRKCTESFELPEQDGHSPIVDVGTTVTMCMYSIHRDPEYYENPEEFKPQRFNEEFGGVKAFRDKGVLFPFGDGPRICIGMRFALTQVKAGLANIINKFEIEVNEGTREPLIIEPKQILNIPIGGLWLNYKALYD